MIISAVRHVYVCVCVSHAFNAMFFYRYVRAFARGYVIHLNIQRRYYFVAGAVILMI